MDNAQYGHTRSNTVDTVDSAATTLLPSASSSKGHSFGEDGKRYADVELIAWEEAQNQDVRKRKNSINQDAEGQHEA